MKKQWQSYQVLKKIQKIWRRDERKLTESFLIEIKNTHYDKKGSLEWRSKQVKCLVDKKSFFLMDVKTVVQKNVKTV